MAFEINPNMNPRNVGNAHKTQAMDNEGRGASAGGGYEGSAFGEAELEAQEDALILSTDDKKQEAQLPEDDDSLWASIIVFFKRLIYKMLKRIQ